jgi:hypothetical protein
MIHREPRLKVLIQARMRVEAGRADICIRDISSRGLLLQANAPPPHGTYIEILLPTCTVVARVVWAKDRRFGVATREPMNLSAIINRTSPVNSGTSKAAITNAHDGMPAHRQTLAAAEVRQRADRSRRLSARLEFVTIAAFAVGAALFMVSAIYETLSPTFAAVSAILQHAHYAYQHSHSDVGFLQFRNMRPLNRLA